MENGVDYRLTLQDLVDYFEESESATDASRKLSERDRDYYDDKQWTDAEETELLKRKQPVVTYNRIKRKIDFLSGLERQQRKDPKAFPRNPKDEQAAQAATDAIRYVCDDEDWDEKRSAAWDNILIEGTGAVFVGVKRTKMGFDPSITHISWDRHFGDPKSSRPDWGDARYQGIVTWYDLDEAKDKWPEKEDVLDASMSDATDETYEDKPRYKTWSEQRNRRVRVCEIYCRKSGVWLRAVYTKAGYLEDLAPSPYLDEEGEPECPIKAVSLYVDRDNNRYGTVRVMISPQDEINKRRSKGLHLITMRQAWVDPASGMKASEVQRALSDPMGVVIARKDEFGIIDHNDFAMGNLNLLQEAKNEIDLLGANAALAGKNESDQSGRAIMAQQQGGMVEVARAFDRLRMLSLEVYRAVWNRIRQVWNEERWVRVTDNDRNLKFVGLNQKVTVQMLVEEAFQGDQQALQQLTGLVGPQVIQAFLQGDERAQMAMGLFVQQNGQQVVGTRNAVNELDVDIVIDEGMDTPSVQAEQFDTLSKVLPGLINLPPQYAKMLVMASQLRDKDQILETLEEQGPSPEQQQAVQVAQAKEEAEIENTQADTAKKVVETQKLKASIPLEAYKTAATV